MSYDEAWPLLEPLVNPAVESLHDSHQLLREVLDGHPILHGALDSSTKASMLSNLFAQRVRPVFAALGVNWLQAGRMQHGVVGGLINLRFKKLTTDLHSMNYPTVTQTRLYHQWPLTGVPELTQVTLGYIDDVLTGAFAGIFFVCPSSFRTNHWAQSLFGADGGQLGIFSGPTDPNVFDPDLDVDVSINQPDVEHG
jgi:hypothetical protein